MEELININLYDSPFQNVPSATRHMELFLRTSFAHSEGLLTLPHLGTLFPRDGQIYS